MSRQRHELIVLLIQLIVGVAVLTIVGSLAWNAVAPIVKQQLAKPVAN